MSNKPIPLGTPIRQKVEILVGRIMHTEYDPVEQTFKHLIEAPKDEAGYAHTFYLPDEACEVDAEQVEKDTAARAEAEAAAAAQPAEGEKL